MCPNGVAWKTLGEVCTIETGKLNANAAEENGQYPFFTTSKEISYINEYKWDTEALLIAGNANIGDVKHYIGKFNAYQRTYVLTNFQNGLIGRFLYHYTKARLKDFLDDKKNEAAMSYIVLSSLQAFPIPLPPIEIQKKIVECLDKFSALAAELQAELQLRRKQYEYYRTQLLTPLSDCNSADNTDDCNWEWKTLGEVCEMKAGIHINAADIRDAIDSEYLYPCFGGNGIRGYVKSYSIIGEYPIIGRQGALCGCVNYAQDKFYATEHAVVVKPYKGYSSRYLFHMLTFADLNQYKSQGAQPGLAVGNLKTLKYAFPPLAEQARIVAILDKFEKLITSMEEGIPAEQIRQQKRYEHFRDLLLAFDRKAV